MSSLSGSFDPAIALFNQSYAEFSELSADDGLRLTKSSLTALLGCKLRSVGLTSSLSFSLEVENASNAENAFEQLAKCSHSVCQSANCKWIHALWDAFKNAWEAERELESLSDLCNDDEFESVSDRAYLTRRDLTSLEGTSEELGLLKVLWSGDSCSLLVTDPSMLGNELTALPETLPGCCAAIGNKRERAKQQREKAARLEELHNLPCTAPHGVPGDLWPPVVKNGLKKFLEALPEAQRKARAKRSDGRLYCWPDSKACENCKSRMADSSFSLVDLRSENAQQADTPQLERWLKASQEEAARSETNEPFTHGQLACRITVLKKVLRARQADQQHKQATPNATAEAQQQAEVTNTPQPASAMQQARQAGQQQEQATPNTTAVAQQQAEATHTPLPAPVVQQAGQAGQLHKQVSPSTTAAVQQQAEATNTPQLAAEMQQARQAGQQHKQATPNKTAAVQQQAEATITPQPAAAMQQAQQGSQQHNLSERAHPRVEHGPAGSQDRSAWRGGRRRAVCTSGTATRHGLCRVRSAAVQPRVQHGAAALTCAMHGAWTTMTRDFLARWTIEPD